MIPSTMLSLSDDELSALMAAARPIPARSRDQFLRDVVSELSKFPEIGPGIIARICARLQRDYLNAPSLRGHVSKYER